MAMEAGIVRPALHVPLQMQLSYLRIRAYDCFDVLSAQTIVKTRMQSLGTTQASLQCRALHALKASEETASNASCGSGLRSGGYSR